MATYTVSQLIDMALEELGEKSAGNPVTPERIRQGLRRLNSMIALWRRQRYLVFHLVEKSVVATGAVSYTIGPTGDMVLDPRPTKIESAFIRMLNSGQPVDKPIGILPAMEDYGRIINKSVTGLPQTLAYDPAHPNGVLYPWPVPLASIYELHVYVPAVLSGFTAVTETVDLPEEYCTALYLNLAVWMQPSSGLDMPQHLVRLAMGAKVVLRDNAAQVPNLVLPPGLPARRGWYDFYSDQVR